MKLSLSFSLSIFGVAFASVYNTLFLRRLGALTTFFLLAESFESMYFLLFCWITHTVMSFFSCERLFWMLVVVQWLQAVLVGGVPFREPPTVLPDANGVVSVTLSVVMCRVHIASYEHNVSYTARVFVASNSSVRLPQQVSADVPLCDVFFSYGDDIYAGPPGPTLVVSPGGVLNVTLVNRLPRILHHSGSQTDSRHPELNYDSQATSWDDDTRAMYRANHWHKQNTLNLHFHGLHVDPAVDDPFRRIAGGDEGNYFVHIPSHHSPGLHWYHTHVHGAVSLQLMGGLFGLILVEDKKDVALRRRRQQQDRATGRNEISHVSTSPAPELAFAWSHQAGESSFRSHLLGKHRQHLPRLAVALHLLKFCNKVDASPFAGWSFADLDRVMHSTTPSAPSVLGVDLLAVNGQLQPTIEIPLDTPVLLHIAYTSGFGEPALIVPSSCFAAVVAADGVSYPTPRRVSRLPFCTATRYDLLLQCVHIGLANVMLDSSHFRNASYFAKARSLGFEPNVVMRLQTRGPLSTVSSGNESSQASKVISGKVPQRARVDESTSWPFLSRAVQRHWLPHRDAMLADLKSNHVRVQLHREISMRQEHSQKQRALAEHQGAATPLPVLYGLGVGSDCAPNAPPTKADCTFEPFPGRRGNHTERYHGFVASIGDVVEARFYHDGDDEKPHPLHFHVNHMQLIAYDAPPGWDSGRRDAALETWGLRIGDWRDTFPVLPGVMTVRWKVTDFSGEVVFHCHTTSHEDLGMMGTYYILPRGDADKDFSSGPVLHYAAVASAARALPSTTVGPMLVLALPPLAVVLMWYLKQRGVI